MEAAEAAIGGSLTVVLVVVDSLFQIWSDRCYSEASLGAPLLLRRPGPKDTQDPVGLATCHLDSYLP